MVVQRHIESYVQEIQYFMRAQTHQKFMLLENCLEHVEFKQVLVKLCRDLETFIFSQEVVDILSHHQSGQSKTQVSFSVHLSRLQVKQEQVIRFAEDIDLIHLYALVDTDSLAVTSL
jgi:hypothetical protein